jgi:hypothetical protein
MSVDLAVQRAIRARLISSPGVVALVPVDAVLDRHERPAPRPSVVIGEAQVLDEGSAIDRTRWRVFHTIHIWTAEPSTEGNKRIAAQLRAALTTGRLDLGPGLHAVDGRVSGMRTMRDPDGETAHGVVTLEVLIQEVAP